MKVVILCGGKGMRLKEETEHKPKPMIEIGGKPILWHIMSIYAYYGFNNFILCLGYKGQVIKQYFLNYKVMNSDFSITIGDNNIKILNSHQEQNRRVILADTGENTMTGARVKRIEKYIDDEQFMLTYGDGVANINILKLLEFHNSHGRIGTVTGVCPPSRFGGLVVEGNQVEDFSEKPQIKEGLINGGFFVFNKKIFDYLQDDDNCILEREPLEKLAADGEMMVYKHKDFWQCVDTYRDLQLLNNLWAGREIERELHFNNIKGTRAPWKIWSDQS